MSKYNIDFDTWALNIADELARFPDKQKALSFIIKRIFEAGMKYEKDSWWRDIDINASIEH